MNKSLRWRALTVAAVLVVALLYLAPTFIPNLPGWWNRFLPNKSINLGLDLKGGIQMIMEVQLDEAVQGALNRLADELRFELAKEKLPLSQVTAANKAVRLESPNPDILRKAQAHLEKNFGIVRIRDINLSAQPAYLIAELRPEEESRIKKLAHDQALIVITRRIDNLGVAEPDIRPQGDNRIIIQLPGYEDVEQARAVIGKTALLEFKLVDNVKTPEEVARMAATGVMPPSQEILYETQYNPRTKEEREAPLLLQRRPLMTGAYLTDARVTTGDTPSQIVVAISFDREGARLFERITRENHKRQLAIVLDGKIYSAPTINEPIPGGRAVISSRGFTVEEATTLVAALRAGAMPAPVVSEGHSVVGPTLGADSIRRGLQAGLIGLALVFIFLTVYYRKSGLTADLALMVNIILILASLAGLGATLTLPGIFGLILTLGMAVDANVLIFERIREEIKAGKTPIAAVEAGFGKAFWTILDSNLTTLITALVLFQFGSGPIRGFAVTLSIGILASMFTAIFMSRIIFDYALFKRRAKQISI